MKYLLIIIGLITLSIDIFGYYSKTIFIKSREEMSLLKDCTYYRFAPGGAVPGGINYSCVTLTKAEIDWIVQVLNKPALVGRLIDDKLISTLATPVNKLNNSLKQVLTDFKGETTNKVLETLQPKSILRKIADVLPRLMGAEY